MLQHDAHPHRASTHRLKYIQFLNSFLTNSVASVRPLRWLALIILMRSGRCLVALRATSVYVVYVSCSASSVQSHMALVLPA